MQQFCRLAAGEPFSFFDCRRPASNFAFIDTRYPGLKTLGHLLSQARLLGAQTYVVETNLEPSGEIIEENEDLAKQGTLKESRTDRVSFFAAPKPPNGKLQFAPESFLGYAIIKTDRFSKRQVESRVYESVIRPPNQKDLYFRRVPTWEVKIGGASFLATGDLFAQQNNRTNCCAHASVRTAMGRINPNNDLTYRRMNELLKVKAPDEGLEANQIAELMEFGGAATVVADFTEKLAYGLEQPAFVKYVYGSVESGFPSIIMFGASGPGSYHSITILGHSFCRSSWVPKAESSYFNIRDGHITSDSWLDHLIAHDDNYGCYLSVPRHFLSNAIPSGKRKRKAVPDTGKVATTISAIPAGVVSSSLELEAQATKMLGIILKSGRNDPLIKAQEQASPWYSRFDRYAREGQLVLRPILIESTDYLDHISDVRDWNGKKVSRHERAALAEFLPPQGPLWMIEVSIPELFAANHRKIGEVLFRSDLSCLDDPNAYVISRLAGFYALVHSTKGGSEVQFAESSINSHIPLYGCK